LIDRLIDCLTASYLKLATVALWQ